MFEVHEILGRNDPYSQFFFEFAGQRFCGVLTPTDLPARKFPHTLKRAAADTLGYQKTAACILQDARSDPHTLHWYQASWP